MSKDIYMYRCTRRPSKTSLHSLSVARLCRRSCCRFSWSPCSVHGESVCPWELKWEGIIPRRRQLIFTPSTGGNDDRPTGQSHGGKPEIRETFVRKLITTIVWLYPRRANRQKVVGTKSSKVSVFPNDFGPSSGYHGCRSAQGNC